MKTVTTLLLLCGAIIGSSFAASTRKQSNLPPWVDCTENSHCPAGYCCMINHERYSYPQCTPLRQQGDVCRPGGPLITNGSRYYPDFTEIVLGNIYLQLCPCANGLTCERRDPYCRPINNPTTEANEVNYNNTDNTIDNAITRE
ncbi:hypothetical protein QAD02_009477 [Eretmocerus hayati]|uniref:Uncharacterized protein n=1 Tax=Eretmocerus hayati TaxID=131215 RepID=A0ACC2N9T6_9HYME|nr:hypothetical protein QAD02_009477 [Eretmocerus hayati]